MTIYAHYPRNWDNIIYWLPNMAKTVTWPLQTIQANQPQIKIQRRIPEFVIDLCLFMYILVLLTIAMPLNWFFSFSSKKMLQLNDCKEDFPLKQYLDFLALDIHENPQNVRSVDSGLVERIQLLVADADIDLDAPLFEEDE